MTMIDVHAEALDTCSAYHEFMLYYQFDKKVVYGFVEGYQDPSFYRSLIDGVLPRHWAVKLIRAGNRNKVIRTCEEMDWARFPPKRVCFFVDRDLSGFDKNGNVLPSNVFVTDQYSIENEVANCETLDRVLEEVLNIAQLAPVENEGIHAAFVEDYALFREAMTTLMAQILLWKWKGERPCLDNIKPKELFLFLNGRIALKAGYVDRQARVAYAVNQCNIPLSTPEELAEAEEVFRQQGGVEKFVRGKYVLWFFVQFVLNIHDAIGTFCSRYGKKKPKIHITLGQENALLILGTRVRPPHSLSNFLTEMYLSYIGELEGTSAA